MPEAHLKENSLEDVYETIVIPALKLAEQDYEIDALDDDTRRFMFRSTKTLIEDLGAQREETPRAKREPGAHRDNGAGRTSGAGANIACVPARNGPDELVAMMLCQ